VPVPSGADAISNFRENENLAYYKVPKSAQVNTLASQATKDVASCDKLGGAANER
jgi:hypothetical protein